MRIKKLLQATVLPFACLAPTTFGAAAVSLFAPALVVMVSAFAIYSAALMWASARHFHPPLRIAPGPAPSGQPSVPRTAPVRPLQPPVQPAPSPAPGALSALINLGFKKGPAQQAIDLALKGGAGTESAVIGAALRSLSQGTRA